MHRHLPRSIQEQLDPSLKRKRYKEDTLQRVAQYIHSDFARHLGRRTFIRTKKELEATVDELLAKKDLSINNKLMRHLQGHYPNLCRKVSVEVAKLRNEKDE